MIVGLDIGGSTTKIVALENEKIIGKLQVKADDGRIGLRRCRKVSQSSRIQVEHVDKLFVTGVGSF